MMTMCSSERCDSKWTPVGRRIASFGMRRRKDFAGMEQDSMAHPQVLATVYPSCLNGGARSVLSESGYKESHTYYWVLRLFSLVTITLQLSIRETYTLHD